MKLSEIPEPDQSFIRKAFFTMPDDVDVVYVDSGTTTVVVPALGPSTHYKQVVQMWRVSATNIIGGWDGSKTLFMWRSERRAEI